MQSGLIELYEGGYNGAGLLSASRRPAWVNDLCEGCEAEADTDTFVTALAGSRQKQSRATLQCALHALHCLLWHYDNAAAVAGGIVAEAQEAAAASGSDEAARSHTAYYNPGLVSIAAVLLVKMRRTDAALNLIDGVLPSSVVLSVASFHCKDRHLRWKPLVDKLIACDPTQRDARRFLVELMDHLSSTLPFEDFVKLLPPQGNTRFFLPFITRAIDRRKAASLKTQAIAAIAANTSG